MTFFLFSLNRGIPRINEKKIMDIDFMKSFLIDIRILVWFTRYLRYRVTGTYLVLQRFLLNFIKF